MSSRSATPASTPSLVNRRLASLLVVLEAPPTADAALDVVEEWAQDLSPLVLAYRKALGAIRDEETELRVAAAVKQLAERASESWVEWARGDWPELATAIDAEAERRVEEQKRLAEEEARRVEEAAKRAKAAEDRRLEDERRRKDEEDRLRQAEDERRAQEAADEELARIAAAEGLLPDSVTVGVDKGKGRARVDDEVTELSDDPSVKTPRTLERPFAMTEVDMAAAAIAKRQAGQKGSGTIVAPGSNVAPEHESWLTAVTWSAPISTMWADATGSVETRLGVTASRYLVRTSGAIDSNSSGVSVTNCDFIERWKISSASFDWMTGTMVLYAGSLPLSFEGFGGVAKFRTFGGA
ncbi:predicted protein [Postia placenta Mad-698-R]|nr:predicted protein [Postia placenta Mad-698-R]